jgi:hypothetical protein
MNSRRALTTISSVVLFTFSLFVAHAAEGDGGVPWPTVMPGEIPRNAAGEVAPGEIPLTPPLFDNALDRERYRAWWIGEFLRRVAIYQRLEPRPNYPMEPETRRLAVRLYDSGEPRRPGETVDSARARAEAHHAAMMEFFKHFGTMPKSVLTRAGDPQYGMPVPPPVQDPGLSIPPRQSR